MEQTQYEKMITTLFAPFFEKGFRYEYSYEKTSDYSCVFIHRFYHGGDFFDLRTVTGKEITFVVYASSVFRFPTLEKRFPKAYKKFRFKHLFKKPTEEERWAWTAEVLCEELQKGDFFGIPC